jgi:hypothetical protein
MSYSVSEELGSNRKLFRNFFTRDYLKDCNIMCEQFVCAWEALEEDIHAVCVFIVNITSSKLICY